MHKPPLTFARFVPTPETRSALLAVQKVADSLRRPPGRRPPGPLFLHGPPGSGKTHLASALIDEVSRRGPETVVALLAAGDWPGPAAADVEQPANPAEPADPLEPLRQADLVVVEDVQHLPARAHEAIVQVFDELLARERQMVFTATVGPAGLGGAERRFPARLTSRLASGLVVGLDLPSAASRLALLQDKAQRRQLAVGRDVLAWLAEHLPGGVRQLEGALARLELLARMHDRPPDVATVADHFREQADAARPTVERIAEQVGGYFQVEPRQLQSRRRYRKVLLPRQVGMYLARQLTGLSLEQIGAYFGGRDHSTVLHACRKVEQALTQDPALSGAVRHLQADLV